MTIKEHIKQTVKLAVPVSIGHLGHIMLGIVDSLMIGRIGAVPLAASALVNSLLFLILILGIGMSFAITPLVAIKKGEGKKDECGIILRQALLVNIIYSFLLCGVTFFFADLIQFMDQPPEVVALAESYMKILSFSIIPVMIFQTYRQFIEGLGDTKPAMYLNIVANIVNAFGNWVLIYGHLGFPRMELDGAGIASLNTRIFLGAAMLIYVMYSKRYKEYDPSLKFHSINIPVIKNVIRVGIPTGFQMFFEVGAFSFAAVMVGWLGANALAAHQIALNMATISFMIILGIAAAATIRVGNYLGAKNYIELKRAGTVAIFIGVSIMALFGSCFIIFRNQLPLLYIDDVNVISISASLLIFAALFQIFDGTQAVGLGLLRGMIDVKIPMVMAFIAYWIISIPVGYILGFKFDLGPEGVWIGLSVGLIVAAIFFTARFFRNINRQINIFITNKDL